MVEFIVVDGTDGCGKDTQAILIARELINQKKKIMLRIHPSGTIFGRIAKKCLERGGKVFVIITTIFFIFDVFWSWRFYFRDSFNTIIFVRYLMATAYLPSRFIRTGYVFFASFLPKPDLGIFLDVKPGISMERIQKRGGKLEEFESTDKLAKKRRKMRTLAKEFDWKIIDGNGSIEEVYTEVKRLLNVGY
ncbi:MAG: thymidylate kinase [Candidatus Hodarchaeales archaeon]